MHSTQIPGNLAEGETVQEFRIPAPKHTPGPWRVDPVNNCDVQTADGKLEIASSHPGILLGGENPKGDTPIDNARLIAQAPTMLADLTVAAAQLRKYETLHRAKGHLEKAEVNAALAARFEATIAAAVGGSE